jgi:hypothetical protein
METCPMSEKCRKVGMKCEDRKFAKCHFYRLLLKEASILKEKEKWKSLTDPQKEEERRKLARKRYNERYRESRQLEKEVLQIGS